MRPIPCIGVLLAVVGCASHDGGVAPHGRVASSLLGAWRPETYSLPGGERHAVDGRIVFTGSEWQVLFFVRDADGRLARASAEGGCYEIDGDQLVLWHLHRFSVGDELPGLPASSMRMAVHEPAGAVAEPCRVEVSGERMTLRFPSGNAMTFRRVSG